MIGINNGLGRGDGRGNVVLLGLGRWGGLPPPPEFRRLTADLVDQSENAVELGISQQHAAAVSNSALYGVEMTNYE